MTEYSKQVNTQITHLLFHCRKH